MLVASQQYTTVLICKQARAESGRNYKAYELVRGDLAYYCRKSFVLLIMVDTSMLVHNIISLSIANVEIRNLPMEHFFINRPMHDRIFHIMSLSLPTQQCQNIVGQRLYEETETNRRELSLKQRTVN
jgi:hypothetical protein